MENPKKSISKENVFHFQNLLFIFPNISFFKLFHLLNFEYLILIFQNVENHANFENSVKYQEHNFHG